MDCAICSVFYMLPWHLAVMVGLLPVPEIGLSLYNPYSSAILAVSLFPAYTEWNRRYEA